MTHTTTYKPTLMQSLLGRNYKWWYALLYNLNLSLAYSFSSIFALFRDLLPLAISLLIYGKYSTTNEYAIYFIIGNVFLKTCGLVWDISWDFRADIKNGSITTKMLKPSSLLGQYLVVSLGANLYSYLINILIAVIMLIGGGLISSIPLNFNILPAVLLILVGDVIFFFIEVIVGSCAFFVRETNTLIETKNSLIPFLAGALFFLNTNSFTSNFIFLPFAFAVHHPMQIYLGKYDFNQTLMVFAGGIAWCVVLYFLAKWIFKMGLKRNEAVGL
ncbi:MAG: ABC-2 family transporter protein [Candidatus Parcubacteria bacterium]|nr:ABC-2 family transporter protein [Candidatus Paceibacterota bacterium]